MSQPENFEAVVIGSGFGGTILTLTLANKFESDNIANNTAKKVCVLERGQWWLSHEINYTPPNKRDQSYKKNMREFLDDAKRPYHFWPHPDTVRGNIEIASAARDISKTGLYDYRVLGDNVHVIASSGVGGGSLVYSNVTLRPDDSVYTNWPTQNVTDDKLDKKFSFKDVYGNDGKLYANNSPDIGTVVDVDTPIIDYFDIARNFIGVNKITTNAGITKNKLDKTKAFDEAGNDLNKEDPNFTVENIDLSITDVPEGIFGFEKSTPAIKVSRPLISEINKYTSITQTNDCQRQGRCNLGCIPGARHTLNKRLFAAMSPKVGNPKPLEIKELCEVDDIEFIDGQGYKITYFQYDRITEQKEQKQIISNILVVSAGSLGSTELLLKCKKRNHLQLSDMLGQKFFTNGDLFAYMNLVNRKIDITRGPINTSHITFKTPKNNVTTIEDTTIPKIVAPLFATILEMDSNVQTINFTNLTNFLVSNLSFLSGLSASDLLGFFSSTPLQNLIKLFTRIWRNESIRNFLGSNMKNFQPFNNVTRKFLEGLLTLITTDLKDQFSSAEERMSKFFVFSCMGKGEKPGVLSLDQAEKLSLDWSANENNKMFEDIIAGVNRIASKIESGGENRVHTPLWNFTNPSKSTSFVLHPLSGCGMGNDVTDGVVNSYGQVFRNDNSADKKKVYPKLYVVDGAIIPDSLGVNPSLTISALSFRSAKQLIREISVPPLPPQGENKYLPK
jgi:choline dehydrogenase-like flavoprotein